MMNLKRRPGGGVKQEVQNGVMTVFGFVAITPLKIQITM